MTCDFLWPIYIGIGFNFQFDSNIMDVVNIIVAIAGFGFAIYQFICQNKENRKQIEDQNNKNWYLSVLVIPQIERINVFFDKSVEIIKDLKVKIEEHDLLACTRAQRENNERVEAFFSPLEASMSSFDDSIQKAISELELGLQDEMTKMIGDNSLDNSEIERRVMVFKGKLIDTLYRPIRN